MGTSWSIDKNRRDNRVATRENRRMQELRPHSTSPAGTEDGAVDLATIAALDRDQIIDRLTHFDGRCPLDFTEGFLTHKSTSRLRHILVAACKHVAKYHA